MVNGDRRSTARHPNWEDPALDFQDAPEEKAWDEEDGLFDGEEIVVS